MRTNSLDKSHRTPLHLTPLGDLVYLITAGVGGSIVCYLAILAMTVIA